MKDDYLLLREWQQYLVAQGRAEKTIYSYRRALARFQSDLPDPKPLGEVTEQDVVIFLTTLGRRTAAKQLYLQALKSFYTWAYERGHVPDDPARNLHPKAPTVRDADAYSVAEVSALVEAANRRSPRRGLAITACYALGLRRSELCGIAPDDIDWHNRRVHITHAKGDKPRFVEMNTIAEQALIGLKPWWNGTCVGLKDPNVFTMWVNEAAKDVGLPPNRRRAHMLRASFATHLLGDGVPISVVSRLLGHANVAITSRYLAVGAEDKRAAVDKLTL